MNNKPENVPIATLSGLTSLTDVLGILPLPDAIQNEGRQTNSLISNPEILQDARRLLNGEQVDNSLIQRIHCYLSKVNTSYLDFRSASQQRQTDLAREQQLPVLLQQLLENTPQAFTPNYEQYASPSKFVNIDFTTPRHSLLKPHGPQLILSPTRSGHHIPVAHVSPLRQEPPSTPVKPMTPQASPVKRDISPRQPLATASPPKGSKVVSPKVADQVQKQTVSPSASLRTRQQSQPSVSAPPQIDAAPTASSTQPVQAQASTDSQAIVPSKKRRSLSANRDHVRRQLYSEEQTKQAQDSSTVTPTKKQSPVKIVQVSPGSIRVSIDRTDLKVSPEKRELSDSPEKRVYPKRKRIERLKFDESGEEAPKVDEEKHIEPEMTRVTRRRSRSAQNEEFDEKPREEAPKNITLEEQNERDLQAPTDFLLDDKIVRPIIPKLVLKRIKQKRGSKEIEMMEIVSPTKAELGALENYVEQSYEERQDDDGDDDDDVDYQGDVDAGSAGDFESLAEEAQEIVSREEIQPEGAAPTATLQDVVNEEAYPVENIIIDQTIPQVVSEDVSSNLFDVLEKKEDEQKVPEVVETRQLRKRRRISSDSDGNGEQFTDNLQDYSISSKKQRRSRTLHIDDEIELRADSKRLIQLLQEILSTEDELESDGALDFGEDADIPSETLLPRPLITDFYMELSKLKSINLSAELPHDQLVRIVSIMDRHVRESSEVMLNQKQGDEDNEERLWKVLKIDRVLRASEAALIILRITTAPGMPKQVYMEEVIEHVVSFCRHHLENAIYPEYDPVYRIDPNSKFDSSVMLPKSRRARGMNMNSAKQKPILQLYNKLCELVSLIGDLVSMENLTDIIILKISTIGTAPFFVENVSILQLEALKLVRTIFRTYVKHRDLILDDILASLARLPSSKRNLRNYRLFEDTSIQMVTALVLQLVQCTVSMPDTFDKKEDSLVDKDVMIVSSYEDSLRAAQNFLATFLKKCSSASRDENDFRPLFENFLQDILTTLNKPEWPAAEVLLALLGKLLIVTFNNKANEMSLRVSAMDYLALIASHLRRDAVESRGRDKEDLKEIIEQLHSDEEIEDRDDISVDMIDIHINTLRKALLSFLAHGAEKDVSCKFAREFYLGQWIRDVHIEMEKCMKAPMMSIPGAASTEIPTDAGDMSVENIQDLDDKKKYYHSMATDKSVTTLRSSQQKVSYEEACIIAKYLTSSRSFCQSFDIYLQQIFKMLNEPAVALRTKAVKALTSIVTVDPNILGRVYLKIVSAVLGVGPMTLCLLTPRVEDVQVSVHGRFLDQSTLVREAAVDLIGHFVLKCPDITNKYYDMIMERILDTGISVRKRVIKILRDICIEQPEFPKVPEICVKIIRRVNDEEGIRDLVTKVFQKMWFTPVIGSTENSLELAKKATNVMKVVSMCKDCGYDWFENLLDHLLEGDDEHVRTATEKACKQLVTSLVQRLIKTEQDKGSELVSCLTTLYLLCKIRPQLLVQHATTLQPYLSIKCNTQGGALIVQNVARILENVIPLVDHPNPKFLADLEEDLMKLIIKQGQNIVQSCISCLDAVINQVTHNYKFVSDCFKKFHSFLSKAKKDACDKSLNSKFAATRPALLRSLFIAGLLCKHFDFDKHLEENPKEPISLNVLEICLFFAKHSDEEVRLKSIMAVGFICVTKPDYLLRNDCKSLYQSILSEDYRSSRGKCMLLKSLQNHLMEEEERMTKLEGHKKKDRKQKQKEAEGNIKEFGDTQAGTTSAVMQVMLKSILETFFQADAMVRLAAVQVIGIILRQGLIHPAQCVPYLIAAGTDEDKMIRAKAEQSLADIHKRHAGFIHMKAVQGIKLSYQLQKLVQVTNGGYLQGYKEGDSRSALASHVYTMLRPNKQYRRPLLQTILKQFDDQKCPIDMLYYLTENLAYLPYVTQEEPLFVMHHCDMVVSVTGAGHLQNFKELFYPSRSGKGKGKSPHHMEDDDDLEDAEKLNDASADAKRLEEIVRESFSCMLLLELKQHLKQLYGFADSKCQKYSPSEPTKLYDKTMTRRGEITFNSHFKDLMFKQSDLEKDEMVNYYIEFKQLMLSLDSEEDSEESEPKEKKHADGKPNSDNEEHPTNQDHTAHQETVGNVEQPTSKEEKVDIPKEIPQENEERKGGKKMETRQHHLPEDEAAKRVDEDCRSEGSSSSRTRRRSSRSRR